MPDSQNRRLAAILFADIVGYTSLMQKNEAQTLQIIQRYQSLLDTAAQQFNGQVLKNYGDGSLMTFSTSVDAVKAAKQIQEQAKTDITVSLRIGIHVGEFVMEKGDIYGNGVNLASRIESLGIKGAVLFSKNIFQKIKNHPEFQVQSLGNFHFKNVEEPMEVFALANEGFPIPKRTEMQGKLKTPKTKNKTWIIPLIVGALFLTAFGIWKIYFSKDKKYTNDRVAHFSNSPSEEILKKRIAVLFFENKTGSTELDALGEMVADWLTRKLMETGEAQMVNAEFVSNKIKLAGAGMTASPSFSKETGADVVIQGKYYLVGNQLSIHAQMVDAQNGNVLFALPPLKGEKENAMNLLQELTERLTSFWVLRDRNQFKKNPPKYEAYLEYLKYRDHWTVDDKKSLEVLAKAHQLDSTFYLPLIQTVIMYTNKSNDYKADSLIQWIKAQNPQLSTWEELLLTSLEADLNGNRRLYAETQMKRMKMDSEATYFAGIAQLYYLNNPQKTLEVLQTKYTPDYQYGSCPSCQWALARMSDAHFRLGQYQKIVDLTNDLKVSLIDAQTAHLHLRALIHLGEEEALKRQLEFYKKQDLKWYQSHHPAFLYWRVCEAFYLMKKPEAVHQYAQLFFEVSKEYPWQTTFFDGVGQVHYFLKEYKKALEHFQKIENNPSGTLYMDLAVLGMIGACHAQLGDATNAKKYLQKLQQKDQELTSGYSHYFQAAIYAHLGNQEKAMQQLQTAYDQGTLFLWYNFKFDSLLEPLFDYPPFEELVKSKG